MRLSCVAVNVKHLGREWVSIKKGSATTVKDRGLVRTASAADIRHFRGIILQQEMRIHVGT